MNRFFSTIHFIVRPFVKLLMPFRAVGLEKIPEGGALLCANHTSGWDAILIALSLPRNCRMTFMGKEELFRNPLLRWFFTKLGGFPVNRGGNDLTAMKTALKALGDGKRLLVFPEGTRVEKQGDTDAKGGVVMMSTRTGTPIVPIYCGGKKKLFQRYTIVFGDPYMPEIAGRRATQEETHRIAEEILNRIYAMNEVDAWK